MLVVNIACSFAWVHQLKKVNWRIHLALNQTSTHSVHAILKIAAWGLYLLKNWSLTHIVKTLLKIAAWGRCLVKNWPHMHLVNITCSSACECWLKYAAWGLHLVKHQFLSDAVLHSSLHSLGYYQNSTIVSDVECNPQLPKPIKWITVYNWNKADIWKLRADVATHMDMFIQSNTV